MQRSVCLPVVPRARLMKLWIALFLHLGYINRQITSLVRNTNHRILPHRVYLQWMIVCIWAPVKRGGVSDLAELPSESARGSYWSSLDWSPWWLFSSLFYAWAVGKAWVSFSFTFLSTSSISQSLNLVLRIELSLPLGYFTGCYIWAWTRIFLCRSNKEPVLVQLIFSRFISFGTMGFCASIYWVFLKSATWAYTDLAGALSVVLKFLRAGRYESPKRVSSFLWLKSSSATGVVLVHFVIEFAVWLRKAS